MLPNRPYLRSAELAKIFDVNPSTISLWVKKGKLKPQKTLGGNFRFRRSDVEKLMAEQVQAKHAQHNYKERRKEKRYAFCCPVVVRIDAERPFSSYDAEIQDISTHGLNLLVHDNNGFTHRLESGRVNRLAILNLPRRLFREVVEGEIRHFEKVGARWIAVGLRLDPGG